MRPRVLLAALALVAFQATAGVPGAPRCASAGTQSELNACAGDELASADAELNAVYGRILAEYRGDAVFLAKLKTAQRLWIRLRDAEVDARFPVPDGERANVVWGSSYPMRVAGYRADLTQQRPRQLRIWLDGLPEGDLFAGSVHSKDSH